jgi:putative aldouronate transport system permease protein
MKYYDKNDKTFNFIINFVLAIVALTIILPLLYVLANSLSSIEEVFHNNVWLIPKGWSLDAYKYILSNDKILIGYKNTALYTIIGTTISLIMTLTSAYALSRKDLKHRKGISIFFVLTMFISGGMIPTYLVVDGLGMIDTIWGFIIPGSLSVWNVLVVKTYYESTIPWELQESAMIDGCSDFKLFAHIVLPLSAPIIAVMTLFYAVGYWNSYFNSLIYLSSSDLFPLQRVISDLLVAEDVTGFGSGSYSEQGMMLKSLQFTSIIISSLPMLLLYPMLQRYFTKGIMMGSLKG